MLVCKWEVGGGEAKRGYRNMAASTFESCEFLVYPKFSDMT